MIGDDYQILSAEHGLLDPDHRITAYDTTVDDLAGTPIETSAADCEFPRRHATVTTQLDHWAATVTGSLQEWLSTPRREHTQPGTPSINIDVDVLLGQRYREPLEDRGVFRAATQACSDVTVSINFPFQEEPAAQGGIGHQMGWMTTTVDEHSTSTDSQ